MYINKIIAFFYVVVALTSFTAICHAQSCGQPQFKPLMQQIKAMLSCWNKGDLQCVVNDFHADNFIYVGNEIMTRKSQMKQHYQQAFQQQHSNKLGKLTFEFIDCKQLGPKYFTTIQQYTLVNDKQRNQGYDILLWRQQSERYKIVVDFPKEITSR